MFWDAAKIIGYKVSATDGEIGTVKDILFEDSTWTLRWLVVATGNWFTSRDVLLPLSALGTPDPEFQHFPVMLTKQQVKDSPDIKTDLPVSRQMEAQIYAYYSWDPYWAGNFFPMSNAMATPYVSVMPTIELPEPEALAQPENPHLRSITAIIGYDIHATDGDIGYVEDFVLGGALWRIRYLKIDKVTWMPGAQVVISPQSIRYIDSTERTIYINVNRQRVNDSPKYSDDLARDGKYDEKFLTYYGIKWVDNVPEHK
jgi:uncharacterized protein YrrD